MGSEMCIRDSRKIIGDLSDREKVLIGLDLLFDELTETEYSGDK